MNQNFDEGFQMAITESCSKCMEQNRKHDSQYQQWNQEVGKLYDSLRKKLGKEGSCDSVSGSADAVFGN